MYQLIFISTVTRILSDSSLEFLSDKYSKSNKINGITSLMLFSGSSFLQLLEGEQEKVECLYEKIAHDSLNAGNNILFAREVQSRSFPAQSFDFRKVEAITFESIYCLCLTAPDDALKKMDLMTNLKIKNVQGFDPERLMFYQKGKPVLPINIQNVFEFATEVAADEVFIMKPDSQIVYVNHSACEKLGYDKAELIGKHVWEWDPLFPKEVWPGYYQELLEKQHLHFQTQHRKKSGQVFPVEIHVHLFEYQGETLSLAFVSDISDQHKAQKALLDHKRDLEKVIEMRTKELNKTIVNLQFYKKILDKHSGISITDPAGNICYVNDLMLKPCGYSREELIGSNHRILKSGLQDKNFYKSMYRTITRGEMWQGEICNRAKDGSIYWLSITIVPQLDLRNQIVQYYSIRTDITEKKQSQIEIQQREEKLSAILNNVSDGIHIVSQQGKIVECSLSFARMLGYSKDEVLQLAIWDIDPLVTQAEIISQLNVLKEPLLFQRKHHRKDGSTLDVEVTVSSIYLKGERLSCCSSRDISKRLKAQREVELLARTDQLTGVANRHKFIEYFDHLLKIASRQGKSLFLAYVDLDDFKFINDNFGHAIGDAVLKHVASLLQLYCRNYDLVSRLGGDEFSVLIYDIEINRVKVFAENILTALKENPLLHEDSVVPIGLSIGLSRFPNHGNDIEALMKTADAALYQAKHNGKGSYVLFGDDQ